MAASRKAVLVPLHHAPPTRNDVYNMFDPAEICRRASPITPSWCTRRAKIWATFLAFRIRRFEPSRAPIDSPEQQSSRHDHSHSASVGATAEFDPRLARQGVFELREIVPRRGCPADLFKDEYVHERAPPAVASRVVDLVLYFCVRDEGPSTGQHATVMLL